jgi:hypothetical protein
MEFYVIIALLIGVIVVQHISHKQERKDLYNRIMARDLTEYKSDGKVRSVKNIIRKNMEKRKTPQ